jgi:23S rRNA maturation-related 3'-5' exoribonuclease YhaM
MHKSLCPIPGVVEQTKALIQSIGNEPLRAMVLGALAQPEAAIGYWTTPASLHDHHAYDGGLALHSLEVATMVASSVGLPDDDRDLGIALALLHDYGKIWCYRDGAYTNEQRRGHVRVGFEKLASLVTELHQHDHVIAAKLEELLGGRSQRADRRYPLAVGRIVNAFDQLSCEKTRATHLTT